MEEPNEKQTQGVEPNAVKSVADPTVGAGLQVEQPHTPITQDRYIGKNGQVWTAEQWKNASADERNFFLNGD